MSFRIPLAATLIWLVWAPAASAQLPQQSGAVDLLTQANVQVDGIVDDDEIGEALAAAGDVNGDGLGDVIAGADGNDVGDRGTAWVIFGRPTPGPIDLATLGSGGMRIIGEAPGDNAADVEAAGDVNGDGLDDLLVGTWADPSGRMDAGSVYVVFGRRDGGTVDLSQPGAAVRIDGAAEEDNMSVAAGAGDFDGDGTDDLVVGARWADHNGRDSSGSAYVISGAALTGPAIDLAAPGPALLLRIDGAAADDELAGADSLAGIGDFNGDDRDDILLGASGASNNGRQWSGSAYVVFGSDATGTLDLAALGTRGVQIDGAAALNFLGAAVGAAPDMNADGLADIVLGAPRANGSGGSAYLIFGRSAPGTIDAAALGTAGIRFDGDAGYWAGTAVGPAGDVNDDGFGDLLIGASDTDPFGRQNAGSVFVVYGPVTAPVTQLSALGAGGIRIDGALESSFTGDQVAGPGDFNGDGRDDVIAAGPHTDLGAGAEQGSLYLVYGFGPASLSYPGAIAGRVGEPVAPFAPAVRRTGATAFTVAPALPDGLVLDPATGAISGTPRVQANATRHTVTMTDLTGSTTASVAVQVDAAPLTPAGIAAAVPAVSALKVTPRCAASARRMAVRFHLSAATTVRLEVARRVGGPRAGIRCLRGARFRAGAARARTITVRRQLAAGQHSLRLGRRLRPGPYVVRVSVPGGQAMAAPFRIRAR